MRYSEAKSGRIFVLRLEDGEVLHEVIETFAAEKEIRSATVEVLGGADCGSRLVVGPQEDRAVPPVPQKVSLRGVHEVAGVGTIFPDDSGNPILHLHLACGRGEQTVTGCVRAGVKTWHVLEVIIRELLDTPACRRKDSVTGFKLLDPG